MDFGIWQEFFRSIENAKEATPHASTAVDPAPRRMLAALELASSTSTRSAVNEHEKKGQSLPLPKTTDPEEYREAYLALAMPLLRVKVQGSRFHHLVPYDAPKRRRIALCGATPRNLTLDLNESCKWVQVQGEDLCCQLCNNIASRGRYIVRPLKRRNRK